MTIGLLYICLLTVGVVYAVIAGVMGWLADFGDGDFHVDAGGHVDAGHPHPISGTTVATFITGFGGGGVVGHYLFELPLLGSLSVACGLGLVLAGAAFGVLEIIFKHTQAGCEFTVEEAEGREAQVTTPIPENGNGEVAFTVRGQRECARARSIDGSAIDRGKLVVIEKVMGATVYVRAKS